MEWDLGVLRRAEVPAAGGTTVRLEHKPLTAITKADVESVRDGRRAQAQESASTERVRPGCKGGEVGINRLLARLRHVFSFAIAEGYATETPFKRHGVTVVKLDSRVETPRHRRLEPGEEDRLLRHAGDHLRALIVALLFTGCRVGELLNLTWNQIRRDEDDKPRWLMLPATNTKTYRLRPIPIGVRLSSELDMRQHGPDGTAFGPDAFVFGNRVGEKINSARPRGQEPAAEQGSAVSRFVTCAASSRLGCGSQGRRITMCGTSSGTPTSRQRAGIWPARRCGWNRRWRSWKPASSLVRRIRRRSTGRVLCRPTQTSR